MIKVKAKLINELEMLTYWCEIFRKFGEKIVLTTGAFDLLHDGHLIYLLQAREFGDRLVVGINSDKFVKGLKGDDRPIYPEKERAFMVAGFSCVDLVHVFDDRVAIVDAVRPNIMVMSSTSHAAPDTPPRLKQRELVEVHGGRVIVLGSASENSTTKVIARLRGLK